MKKLTQKNEYFYLLRHLKRLSCPSLGVSIPKRQKTHLVITETIS